MPLQARAELRAEEDRPRRLQEARGKVIDGAGSQSPASFSIIVLADGIAKVDGGSLDDAALEAALKKRVESDAGVRVVFTVDKSVPHKRVVALMEIAKRAGVKAMTLAAPIAISVPDKPPSPDKTPAMVLSIDKAGTMFLGSRAVAEAELGAEFKKLAKAGRKKLVIAADGSVTYGTIAKVLELAKTAGLDVGFMTR